MLIMAYSNTPTKAKDSNDSSKESMMLSLETPTTATSSQCGGRSLSGSVGRFKSPPKCDDPVFRAEAMSSEELSKFVFPPGQPAVARILAKAAQKTSSIVTLSYSSSSSSSSNESHSLQNVVNSSGHECKRINANVLSRQMSRQGRETQRWVTDTNSHQVMRLVTGCVPILNNGKILFVSASRKPEWILPKGGWEDDETMEEGAIRETFEEAGVVGMLGPPLSEVEYETRKSKKRKADLEDVMKRQGLEVSSAEINVCQAQPPSTACSGPAGTSHDALSLEGKGEKYDPHVTFSDEDPVLLSDAAVARIRGSAKMSDETSSITSDTSTYSHVRMTLFPLYVSEVKEDWPESGRFRKAVDIDEAILMLEKRTEFHAFLMEVKEKGLHLVSTLP
jgi:NUDIX domain